MPHPNRDDVGSIASGQADAPRPAPRRPSTMSIATPSAGAPAPPPRPRVSSDLAPPRPTDRPPRPGSIGIATSFWTASFLVALMAFVAAYTDRATVRDQLTASAVAEDPTIAADVLRDGVSLTMATVLVANVLLLLLAGLCLALALRGRRAARWILVVLGLLILLAIDFDQKLGGRRVRGRPDPAVDRGRTGGRRDRGAAHQLLRRMDPRRRTLNRRSCSHRRGPLRTPAALRRPVRPRRPPSLRAAPRRCAGRRPPCRRRSVVRAGRPRGPASARPRRAARPGARGPERRVAAKCARPGSRRRR